MLERIENRGVVYFKSTILKSRHAFSTRIGGVSELPHTKSLNLAFGLGDDRTTVYCNLERFSSVIGIDPTKIISVPQIHSNIVRTVDSAHAGEGVYGVPTQSCDGYVTVESDLPIAIKTADCVPILLEARNGDGDVIAVSAIHAGWRGTADAIARVAVERLISLGAAVENIYVAIGACIDECCYEVGIDFANAINEKLGQNYENEFIKKKENGSLYANLKGMNIEILTSCGVPLNNIDVSPCCTCCDENTFYSHRRQKGQRGAMMSVICK